MHVGFTYDLKSDYRAEGYSEEACAELDRPDTIAGIERELLALGHTVERVGHVQRLARRLVDGARWDLVFNIAEGVHGIGRESQVPALLDAHAIPYTFSDPVVTGVTLHKAFAKCVFRANGLATADFRVIESGDDLAGVDLDLPLFAKPNGEGTGKGIDARSIVRSKRALGATCRRLLSRHAQPVLVESYLPGREFTVGIVGTGAAARTLGVLEIELLGNAEAGGYTYENKDRYEDRVRYRLAEDAPAEEAADLALRAWRAIGARDAGRIDLRCGEDGRPRLLEVNALPGLNPIDSDLPILCRLAGIEYRTLIGWIVESAAGRIAGGVARSAA